jgi:hypothetical protein
MRRNRLSLVLVLSIAVSGPVTSLRAQDSLAVEKPTTDLITRQQMLDNKFSSLYELVEAVHNNWLRERIPSPTDRSNTRADTSGKAQYTTDMNNGKTFPGQNGGIQVYLDGTRLGGVDQLKSIRPAELYSARRINGVDAQARFGIGHGAGVIYVLTLNSAGRNP